MECTQILDDSEEDSPESSTHKRRQVATLKTDGDEYPIFLGENRIGRDPKTCSIVIDNMALSSQHAVIEGLSCGSFLIFDLNSRNKTRIGKMSLTPQVRYQLKNGENLRFANIQCTFSLKESINLVHVSFDDDIEELKNDNKEEAAESTSAGDDSIFDAETQRPEEMENQSKMTEESVFKIPAQMKSINTSVISLDESVGSNGDDIFDLPTQPFAFEEKNIIRKEEVKVDVIRKDMSINEERVKKEEGKEEMDEKVEDKDKNLDESDLDDIFEAATQVYPVESNKLGVYKKDPDCEKSSSCSIKISGENIISSVDKKVGMKDSSKGQQGGKDLIGNVLFDAPIQALNLEIQSSQQEKIKSTEICSQPSSVPETTTKADTENFEIDGNIPVEEEKGDVRQKKYDQVLQDYSKSDSLDSSTPKKSQKFEDKDNSEENHDFSINEDSDDALLASLSTHEIEMSQTKFAVDSSKNGEPTLLDSSVVIREGNHIKQPDTSKDPDSDGTDPEDSFSYKVKEMEVKILDDEEENKKKADLCCVNSENDINESMVSSPHIKSDDDTDIEDMCPPSIKKMSSSQKFSFRKTVDRTKLGIGESSLTISTTENPSKLQGSCENYKKPEVKVDEFTKDEDNSFGILVDATFDEENISNNGNQPRSLVIMSDTDDEKDDSFSKLSEKNLNEEKLNISTSEVLREESVEVRKGTSVTQLVSKGKNSFKKEKPSKDLSRTKAGEPTSSEQLRTDKHDISLTQAPEDFKTPLASKIELIDESDISLLETQIPPSSIMNSEVKENACKISSSNNGEEEEDDMSSFLTQAPPDFTTPQSTNKPFDESEKSILDAKPSLTLDTPKVSNRNDKRDPRSMLSSVSQENITEDEDDDMSSFLTQAPPDFKTPEAAKEISTEESALSILETQAPLSPKGQAEPKNADEGDLNQSSSSLVKSIEAEDDVSSFLTQAPPDFSTPQAFKGKLMDESDVHLLGSNSPQSEVTHKVSAEINQGDMGDLSSVDKGNSTNDEEEEDMSSFLTQAPPEFKTPQAIKEVSVEDSDVSMLETQAPPSPKTFAASNIADEGGSTTCDANKEVSVEDSDVNMLETQAPPSPKTFAASNIADEGGSTTCDAIKEVSVEDSDVSMLETQAPPSPKTFAASSIADEGGSTICDANQSSTSDINEGKDTEQEDDISSFLIQGSSDLKIPQATKEKSSDESYINTLETQASPDTETPIVPKTNNIDYLKKVNQKQSQSLNISTEEVEDSSLLLTNAPPKFKIPVMIKDNESADDFDVSVLETQIPPSETPDAKVEDQGEGSKQETPSSKLKEENVIPTQEVEKPSLDDKSVNLTKEKTNEVECRSELEAQQQGESMGDEEEGEDMSSFLTQAPPDFQTPRGLSEKSVDGKLYSYTLEASKMFESKEEHSRSFLTSLDVCIPTVDMKKEIEDVQNITESIAGEKSDTSVEEDDIKTCQAQCQNSIPIPASLSINAAVENVSDEEDVSLLETQPTPVPENVVNGKQDVIDILGKPSNVLKEVTPSRTLRKKIHLKMEKEAGNSELFKRSRRCIDPVESVVNDDDDIAGILPDTPDLAATLQESRLSMSSKGKNLFNIDPVISLSQEIGGVDASIISTKPEGRKSSSENSKERKESPRKNHPEGERRNPTRGNATKKVESEGNSSSIGDHSKSSRKQKEQSFNEEGTSSLEKNEEVSLDLLTKVEETLPKRKSLREKRIKAMDVQGSKTQGKENIIIEDTGRKVNLRKRKESSQEDLEVHSTADEPARKRGRPTKRQLENDAKDKTLEGIPTKVKTSKDGEREVLNIEIKNLQLQEVNKGSEMKQTAGKRRRSLIEEVSSEANDAHKPQIDTSSPRKRSLRGDDREVQPLAKDLRVKKKYDKLPSKSRTDESVLTHRLRGNYAKEDQSVKVLSSPTSPRKRKLEIVKSELKSPIKLPQYDVIEGVRRSVRERKPKRRYSVEEKPKDDRTTLYEHNKKGKVSKLNKKDLTQEKEVPEPSPQEAKRRKLDEKKASEEGKKIQSTLESEKDDYFAVLSSDKRRRKCRSSLEDSASDGFKTENKESYKDDSQNNEKVVRGSNRRGNRGSNTPKKNISKDTTSENKFTAKQLSPTKFTARGKRTTKQSVPESTTYDREELEIPSATQDMQTQAIRGGRRSSRRLTSSEESVPVSSSVEVKVVPIKIEPLKPKENIRGGRNRGRKDYEVTSEVTSSEVITSTHKPEIEPTIEEETNPRTRRGRKGSVRQTSTIDKEDRVSSSTSVNPRPDETVTETNFSYLKNSPVKGRMTAFSPRASSSQIVIDDKKNKGLRNRCQRGDSYKVLFTGLNEHKLEELVERLGGKVVQTPQDCSILVTDRLRRTYKLLCVVARGIPIVTIQWLAQSSTAGRFLDPADFFISDKLTEKRFDFSLKTSLEKARTEPLLAGLSIIATPSVKPPPEEIKGIVTSAGGEYLPSLSALKQKNPSQLYVVSCQDDSAVWKNYLECADVKRPSRLRSERGKGRSVKDSLNVRLVGVEGLLVSILRQKIDLDDKMFSLG